LNVVTALQASVEASMAATVAAFGKVDIVVNCAGIVGPTGKKIDEVDVAAFDKVYEVNLRGSFNVTKAAIPHMKANDYGRILLIASIAGKEGNAGMCAYSTSKAGVYGSRFSAETHTRGCLKRAGVGTNGIPLGCPLFLPVHTVNYVQTLKDWPGQSCRQRVCRD
jgi:NAD(P)-dependent dehydrogenase (short-subunit alcohol dehydrogenase family)